MASTAPIEIGIIGGVGQQLELQEAERIDVRTPYGPTSTPVAVGQLGGKRVAYVIRRGVDSTIQPHLVPYCANVWALASLGVTSLITTTAAGGLRDSFPPGVFVVTDQLIDRTSNRPLTFFDRGEAFELAPTEPFDPTLRGLAAEALVDQGVRHRDFGTAVVINGPRFSTRAESRWHAAAGADLVVTTLMPETVLALELGMGVVNVSFVTDSDAGTSGGPAEQVSAELVRRRVAQARPVLVRTVTEIARRVPAGFRPATAVPTDLVAGVLARPAV
ncbi:MTAP family purine nucleoside phosphorylase [Amnibacterium kyonggiense]|uniref:S-methyl-5'-thioadenosine phosphorylase n=1 Tax=Amnibacterium kyonggiense TaxID=595671 RepID=A0A4R7FS70_9MICO|nr:MTAP family purine nucleoside phosphorylase [Amnibacterium kyonggiense]TDS80691.1 methylthioadenosine phosphorylase [Amnibacterium kyonggiense]